MRTGQRKPNGHLELGPMDTEQLTDVQRYMKLRGGMSIHEMAVAEGVAPEKIEQSVKIGSRMYEAEYQIRLRDAKYESAIGNELIRTTLRKKVADQLVDAVEFLVQGERSVVEINKETGEVTIHKIRDPEIVALGVDAASRILSLPEKAAPNMVFNLQQNMVNEAPAMTLSGGASYEERLSAIQEAQLRNVPRGRELIEVSPVEAKEAAEESRPEEEEEELF